MLDLGIGCVCPLRNQNGMKMLRTFQKTATRLCLSLAPGHQLASVRRALGSRSQSTNSASESRGYSSIFIPSYPHCYFIQALKGCGIFGRLGDSSWMRYSVDYTTEHAKNTDYLNNILCFLATSSLLFVVIVFRILSTCFFYALRYKLYLWFYCLILSFLLCLPLFVFFLFLID